MTSKQKSSDNFFQKIFTSLQFLLFPFSVLYGLIIFIRNKLYDTGVLSSIEFDVPVIAVGNLSVGGTGKTPHVEYLLQLLSGLFPVATLSRGYNRKTQGFYLADENSNALDIGDEPMQFHMKYPEAVVAVSEDRVLAIPQILMEVPDTKVILLDDAFQHRSVKPGLNIMVTDYHHLFTRDHIVPFGRLRESRNGYHRADCIIVSKCPPDMAEKEKKQLLQEIKPLPHQQVFFTTMIYQTPYDLFTGEKISFNATPLLLLTGIAKPAPLENYVQQHFNVFNIMNFRDHHYFSSKDIEQIAFYFDQNNSADRYIITTEKDAVRLKIVEDMIKEKHLPMAVLPMQVQFLFDEAVQFEKYIFNYVRQYQEI